MMENVYTFEEVVFQTTTWHELVNEDSFFLLAAVADKFDWIWVLKLSKKYDLRLHMEIVKC